MGDLVTALSVSQPAVSKHLRVLRQAGLVGVRASGQHRLYRVLPENLREIDEWLAPYRSMWAERLDALERVPSSLPASPDASPGARRPGARREEET